MRTTLHKYLTSLFPLSVDELYAFNGILVERTLQKKELFAEYGKTCHKVLFVADGYFRFFHTDHKGNEITSDFYFAPTFITSYTSFITGLPSGVNVQAMTDMDVLEFSKHQLYALYDQFPGIERLGRLIAESIAINSEEHLFLLLNQTAEIRYKRLLEKYPHYVNIIPLQYIASYLGIKQETLSRMRKMIR